MKRVLVIGGAGYLGSEIVLDLLKNGFRVRVLDSLIHGISLPKEVLGSKNFELHKGEIRDISVMSKAILDVDSVIHLAAIVGDAACDLDSKITEDINFLPVRNIIDLCIKNNIKRLLFASTCSVYGASEDFLTETSGLNPLSLYAQTKISSEKLLLKSQSDNFHPTIFRMATLFGLSNRMRFDLVVNILTSKAFFEGKIPIFGGNQWRPNVHVRDAARAFTLALKSNIDKVSGQIFNVGSNDLNYRIEDMGYLVKKCIPESRLEIMKTVTDERNYKVKFDKIKERLNFSCEFGVEEGVYEIVNFLKQNPDLDVTKKEYSNYLLFKDRIIEMSMASGESEFIE